MARKKKSNAGRPTVMTPETINKLEEAFALGCTDREACLFAGITPPTLYDYQKLNPDFLTRKELLKENPVLLARTSVVNGLSGDPDLALKFLERKKKDEFSPKQINENTEKVELEEATIEELEAELEKLRQEEI